MTRHPFPIFTGNPLKQPPNKKNLQAFINVFNLYCRTLFTETLEDEITMSRCNIQIEIGKKHFDFDGISYALKEIGVPQTIGLKKGYTYNYIENWRLIISDRYIPIIKLSDPQPFAKIYMIKAAYFFDETNPVYQKIAELIK